MLSVNEIIDGILRLASDYQSKNVVPAYYLESRDDGSDEGGTYCRKCAWARRKGYEVRVADSSANYDSEPRCDNDECGATLQGWLTDWGAESTLGYLEEGNFDIAEPSECYAWMLCENSFLKDSDEYKRLVALAASKQIAAKLDELNGAKP